MNHPAKPIVRIIRIKLVVIILLAVSGIGAFATLGDGKVKSDKTRHSLLSGKTILQNGSFSLKSGYYYRGSQVISPANENYINMNTVVSYQSGHTTYVMPLKKKIVLDKVTFNPNANTRSRY